MAVLFAMGPAFRTIFALQVKSGADFAFRKKLTPAAVGAVIVRRQGVDFRDTRHRGDKGRTHRSTRTDLVAASFTFGNQLLRDHVKNGETVLDRKSVV